MGRYHERILGMTGITPTVVNDVTVLATAQTTSTFTMTPTRVDTATANTATGAITASATDATVATNMQVAIRALGGIYADATVTAGTTDTYIITVLGGYDITWATTATSPTVTEAGSAGGVTAVVGSNSYTGTIPVGRFCVAKRVRLSGFNDNSLDCSIVDANAKDVFVKTALDTSTTAADVPYDKYITADGVAGEDGAAAASVGGGFFEGPLTVLMATSAPSTGFVKLFADLGNPNGSAFKTRSTGTFLGTTQEVNLGAAVAKIKAIKLKSTSDTSVDPVITDAYGKNIYTKSATDYTTAVYAQLSHEGVDQGATAVADTLEVIAKSPVLVTVAAHDGTGFKVEFFVET